MKISMDVMYWILVIVFCIVGFSIPDLFHKNFVVVIIGIGILGYILKSHRILIKVISKEE